MDVLQALQQLYHHPDMEQKNAAQRWLTRAQASPQAWAFCWALLGPDKVRPGAPPGVRPGAPPGVRPGAPLSPKHITTQTTNGCKGLCCVMVFVLSVVVRVSVGIQSRDTVSL